MKNTVISILISILICACNNTEEKKESGKIGSVTLTKPIQTDLEKSIARGNEVYQNFCIQCHLASGKGVPNNFPPLAGSNWLTDKRTESIHSVKFGLRGEIVVNNVTYDGVMTPLGLSDEEVADVMNYIMNSWGNTQENMVTVEEVIAVEK